MKKIQFVTKVILVLYLTSCAPTATTLPATLIPPPTIIPTQTPQPPSPAFLDLQEKIAKSDIYTLTPNGIEMKNEDGTISEIKNIKPNPQDGTFTITYEDNKYLVEFISLDGQILTFKDEEENTFIFNEKNLFKTLSQEQLDQMTDEEKLKKAPEKMADLTKNNISTVKNNLVIYRDSETNAQKVFDLLTGKELTLPEAGIIEIPLTTGENWETRYFNDGQSLINYASEDGAKGSTMDMQNNPDRKRMEDIIYKIPGWGDDFGGGRQVFDSPDSKSAVFSIMIFSYEQGSFVFYVGNDNLFRIFYVDQNPKSISNDINNRLILATVDITE